ncbi:MAG TPA: hypothetical protein VGK87_14775, partial [Anaerolineae bacterium]
MTLYQHHYKLFECYARQYIGTLYEGIEPAHAAAGTMAGESAGSGDFDASRQHSRLACTATSAPMKH